MKTSVECRVSGIDLVGKQERRSRGKIEEAASYTAPAERTTQFLF